MAIFRYWPNRITMLRFAGSLILFTIFALFGEQDPPPRAWMHVAFWLFVVVAATDFLDGYLARRNQVVTAFGRIADPFTDKVLVLGSMIFMAVMPWSREWMHPAVVVVILAREFLVTGIRGYVESVGKEFPADRFGKLKMVLQCLLIGDLMWIHLFPWPDALLGLWRALAWVFLWATVISTVGSGITYVLRTRRLLAGTSS